jgi:hypothetical protein
MRKLIIVAMAAFILTGCNGDPQEVQSAGDFRVGKLFTVDGCTVYRFNDGGRNVYFTNCPGVTNSSYSKGKSGTGYNEVSTSAGQY